MPVTVQRGPVRFQELVIDEPTIGGVPDPDRGFLDNVSDMFATGWLGAFGDSIEQSLVRNRTRQAGFDGLDHVPEGMEDYASAYRWAESPEEIDTITVNIRENLAAKERLSQNSFAANLGYSLVAGVLDPINLIAGPSIKGVGLLRGALEGGASLGMINAGTEVVRHNLDPTSTIEETAVNIGFGFVVSGLIGGGIGMIGRNSEPGIRVQGTVNLTPEQRLRAEASGNQFARAVNAVEGMPVTEVIDFNGMGVKIVDAPTGKVDLNGNPVRAFFRPKEAFEELARREQLSRAVDSALGDVVPERIDEDLLDTGRLDVLAERAVRDADDAPNAAEAATPFGRAADEGEPLATGEKQEVPTEFEDTIFIDVAAIRAKFAKKPWTSPRYAGIDPLPEDAFKTSAEWVNFVVLHELHHKTAKRLDGESVAQYENRINRLAYEEVKAGRLPLSPTDGSAGLEKLALLPTPQGTLMRWAPRDDKVHSLAQGIAGDHATQNIANRAGRPTTPGGSVYQRAHRWFAEYFKAHRAIREGYSKYVRGYAAKGDFNLGLDNFTAGLPLVGTARRQGKMLFDEFNLHVGRAVFDDGEFSIDGRMLDAEDMTIIREAAGKVREVLDHVEGEAKKLGMFERQQVLAREIAWRENANARDEGFLAKAGKKKREAIKARMAARNAELDELRAAADELDAQPMRFEGDDHYWHRLYNVGAIRERYDDFVDLIAMGFAREAGDASAVTPEIRLRAQQTADRIIGEGIEENAYGFPGVRALRSRQIPLSNKELADFILLDADTVMNTYIRRMGAAIEMHRAYGSRNLAQQIDELEAHMIEQGYSAKARENVVWEMEAMRDRVLGNFHSKDPLSWDNRTARAAKNFGQLTLMGRGIYAQFVDMARTVAAEGYGTTFQALKRAIDDGFKSVDRGSYARVGGEAFEFAMARANARAMEQDSAIIVTKQTGLERALAKAQAPFFTMNLMNPFTVIWKDFSSFMTAHRLVADSRRLAKAIRSGKTLETLSKSESKISAELASWGIDARRAMLIADMPVDTSTNGLLLPNLDAWTGRDGEAAREAFIGALSGNLRSNVVTPGPLQRAAIMDGVFKVKKGGVVSRVLGDGSDRLEMPLLSLPFQLLSFSTSAGAKVTHSILSGRDRNRYITLSSLLIGGYISGWLASVNGSWERKSWEEQLFEAMDRSGILSWGLDPIKRVEALTGYGPRAAMGEEAFGAGEANPKVAAVAGPAPGIMAGVAEAFIADDLTDSREAALIRRGIPMAGLVWWDGTVREWSKAIAVNSGIELDSGFDEFDEEDFIEPELVE